MYERSETIMLEMFTYYKYVNLDYSENMSNK